MQIVGKMRKNILKGQLKGISLCILKDDTCFVFIWFTDTAGADQWKQKLQLRTGLPSQTIQFWFNQQLNSWQKCYSFNDMNGMSQW